MYLKTICRVFCLWIISAQTKRGETVSTNTTEGISFSLATPQVNESKNYCAYLTCRQNYKPEINVINGIKIFNIAANGSEIASISFYKSYVSNDGFEFLEKRLTQFKAHMVVSVAKEMSCKYGAYLCVVFYIDQYGSKRMNTAIVRSDAMGKPTSMGDRALFELQEKLSTKMSLLETMLTRIEAKVNVADKTYALVSKVLESYNLLDTAKSDWILAFRGTPFIDKSVYSAYLDGTGIPHTIEIGCKTTNSSLPCYNHYRNNSILDNWTNIKEVKFAIYQHNIQVHYVIFDGQGSNYMSWFTQRRILSSSWSDIKWKPSNYFSIAGSLVVKRHFFINNAYPPPGCPADIGWFVAIGQMNCLYEASSFYPLFKFAKGNEAIAYQGPNVGVADMIAIFVKKT